MIPSSTSLSSNGLSTATPACSDSSSERELLGLLGLPRRDQGVVEGERGDAGVRGRLGEDPLDGRQGVPLGEHLADEGETGDMRDRVQPGAPDHPGRREQARLAYARTLRTVIPTLRASSSMVSSSDAPLDS